MAIFINFNLLVLNGIKNLHNHLTDGVLFIGLSLKKYLDVSKFTEVEVSFFFKSVASHLQLLDFSKKFLALFVKVFLIRSRLFDTSNSGFWF